MYLKHLLVYNNQIKTINMYKANKQILSAYI